MEVQNKLNDQTLPSGSIVHWSDQQSDLTNRRAKVTCGHCGQIRSVTIPRGSKWTGLCLKCVKLRNQDEVLSTGSIVHWHERDPDSNKRAMVTCGKCMQKRMTTLQLHKDRRRFTGFCFQCAHAVRTSDEHLSTGSIIHWGQRDPSNCMRVTVTCGRCKQKRMTTPQLSKEDWSGFCLRCVGIELCDDEHLSTGSIIHWGQRDPEDVKRMLVTCGRCQQQRWTTPTPGKGKAKWLGFCQQCKGLDKKKAFVECLPSGSIIYWAERDPKDASRITVTCGLCGRKRTLPVQQHKSRRNWTGYCKEHTTAGGLIKLAQQLQQAPSSGAQKNDNGGKHGGGRPPSTNKHSRLEATKDVVCQIWDESKSDASVTYEAIASRLQLRDDNVGSKGVAQRLARAGYKGDRPEVVMLILKERSKL